MQQYQGLSEKQAQKTLSQHGENVIAKKRKNSAVKMFAGQFRDAMILILLVSTVISAWMGEYSQSFTIIIIVLVNAVLGFSQEYRTEKTLEKLAQMAAPTAAVVRDGKVRVIPAREIVPQDVVHLQAGDRIPADGVLLSCSSLQCDESMLTGESEQVEKSESASSNRNKVYMGTLATSGKGVMRVSSTGTDTEMGKIAGMLGEIEQQTTPLQKRIAHLSKIIGIVCLLVCAVVAGVGIMRGEAPFDMLLIGISLAVAAIPEGLPAVITIALALSVGRMVKRNALVRRLHAVETLGCANIICSDKTGTLTENRMTARQIRTADRRIQVTGEGNSVKGTFTSGAGTVRPQDSPVVARLFEIAALCNNASIGAHPHEKALRGAMGTKGDTLEILGAPTEGALLVMAAKADIYGDRLGYSIRKEIPFDSTRKRMGTVVEKNGKHLLFVKGAPDLLLKRCTNLMTESGVKPITPEVRKQLLKTNEEMASDALRVLGFAFRDAGGETDINEDNLTFVGFVGLIDPPRAEAYPAVEKCRRAGIRPVMITGDHAATAQAIAKELKIYSSGDRVVTGEELDRMSDSELAAVLPKISVFARVTPAHKLRIVRAFKKTGAVVAMTGDGVNDAPAIKDADIGVSMGITGTDVTKEASSVILLDDNFATLVSAVEEGRVIYGNIRKFVRYLFSCNIGEVVTMFFAMLMGMPVPLLPIQILLVNLATDGLPAIALSVEPADDDVMRMSPRRADESLFSNGLGSIIVLRGMLIGICTLGAFVSLLKSGGSVEIARTGALLTLVMTQLIHVFECKSETKSLFSINPFNNLKLIGAVLVSAALMLICIYNPVLGTVFSTSPLTQAQLLTVAGYTVIVPIVSAVVMQIRSSKRIESK